MRIDDETDATDATTEGIVPTHGETGGVLTGMADALLLSIDGSRFGEELVLRGRLTPPSAPTSSITVQRVLVCTTCNAIVARSKEAPSVYDEPVLFASAIEEGLRQHAAATGHRQARREDRVLYVGNGEE